MYVCMYCGHTHKEIIFKRFLKQKVAGYSIRTTWWQGDRLGGCALYLFIYLFIYYFWLRWVFVAAHGLSLVVASGGYSSLWCVAFSLRWLLLLRSTGSRRMGFSRCGTRAQ